jgi:hypothetical protein
MALIRVSNAMLTQIATLDCSVNIHSLGLLHLNALRLELHMKTAMQTMNAQTLTTVGTLVRMIEELELESVFPCTLKMKQLSLDGKLLLLNILLRSSEGFTNQTNTSLPIISYKDWVRNG